MKFWILVKPETLVFCRDQLVAYLAEKSFFVCIRYAIYNWDHLSLELYENSSKIGRAQLQLQNIGRKQLLGESANNAELWVLESKNFESIETGYCCLNTCKQAFRSLHWQQGINLYFEIDGEKTIYHYSYFHVPDPEKTVVETEYALIRRYI